MDVALHVNCFVHYTLAIQRKTGVCMSYLHYRN